MKMLKTVGKLQHRVNKIEERQSESDAELKKINDIIQQQLVKKGDATPKFLWVQICCPRPTFYK